MTNTRFTLPLEEIAANIAALGVPGLVFTVALSATGLYGGAAIITALVALGPGGIVGGIAFLGVVSIISAGITRFGTEAIIRAVIKELYLKGETKNSLKETVESYWVSNSLKLKIYSMIDNFS